MKRGGRTARASAASDGSRTIVGGAPVSEEFARRDRRRRLRLRRGQRRRAGQGAGRSAEMDHLLDRAATRRDRWSATAPWAPAHGARAWSRATAPRRSTSSAPRCWREIARLYLEAGAEILTTNTFGGSPLKLAPLRPRRARPRRSTARAVRGRARGGRRRRLRLGLGRAHRADARSPTATPSRRAARELRAADRARWPRPAPT